MDLWQNLDKITALFKQSPIKILMLDFDGTLTPIVKSPDQAKLSTTMKNLLVKLSQKEGFYLAILSGRRLEDLKKKVNLKNIIYAGNHGLEGEIFGEKYLFPVPSKALWTLGKIKEQLNQITDKFKETFIEDKDLTLSFHYRLADQQQIPKIKLLINQMLKPYITDRSVSVIAGKKVIDITPNVNWGKGDFAALVIKKISDRTKNHPVAIVIGDDTTDENVFHKLKNQITITVGEKRQSNARYFLKNPNEVVKLLQLLNIMKETTKSENYLAKLRRLEKKIEKKISIIPNFLSFGRD